MAELIKAGVLPMAPAVLIWRVQFTFDVLVLKIPKCILHRIAFYQSLHVRTEAY